MHRRITGKLVIATHNPGKLAEMRELLAPHGVEAVSAGELGLGEPEETGNDFRSNAAIKAIAAAQATRLPAFADDSGIVVDALDGAPGIYNGTPVLDLDYAEDSEAQTDANFVMTGDGRIIEVQGTAEREPFTQDEFLKLMALAQKGIARLVDLQKLAVA